jgi:hypothetical protein
MSKKQTNPVLSFSLLIERGRRVCRVLLGI